MEKWESLRNWLIKESRDPALFRPFKKVLDKMDELDHPTASANIKEMIADAFFKAVLSGEDIDVGNIVESIANSADQSKSCEKS